LLPAATTSTLPLATGAPTPLILPPAQPIATATTLSRTQIPTPITPQQAAPIAT